MYHFEINLVFFKHIEGLKVVAHLYDTAPLQLVLILVARALAAKLPFNCFVIHNSKYDLKSIFE